MTRFPQSNSPRMKRKHHNSLLNFSFIHTYIHTYSGQERPQIKEEEKEEIQSNLLRDDSGTSQDSISQGKRSGLAGQWTRKRFGMSCPRVQTWSKYEGLRLGSVARYGSTLVVGTYHTIGRYLGNYKIK